MARAPLTELVGRHLKPRVLGPLSITECYALFYISAEFVLSYGIGNLHIPKPALQGWLMLAIVCMAVATVFSAWLSDKLGRSLQPGRHPGGVARPVVYRAGACDAWGLELGRRLHLGGRAHQPAGSAGPGRDAPSRHGGRLEPHAHVPERKVTLSARS